MRLTERKWKYPLLLVSEHNLLILFTSKRRKYSGYLVVIESNFIFGPFVGFSDGM